MEKYNIKGLTRIRKHALIYVSRYHSTAKFYRDVYKTQDGQYIIKYKNHIRTVYIDKLYNNVCGWFLNPGIYDK